MPKIMKHSSPMLHTLGCSNRWTIHHVTDTSISLISMKPNKYPNCPKLRVIKITSGSEQIYWDNLVQKYKVIGLNWSIHLCTRLKFYISNAWSLEALLNPYTWLIWGSYTPITSEQCTKWACPQGIQASVLKSLLIVGHLSIPFLLRSSHGYALYQKKYSSESRETCQIMVCNANHSH